MKRIDVPLSGAECWLEPHFIAEATAYELLLKLSNELEWRQDRITLFGRSTLIPRLQCFMGDADIDYSYSGLKLEPTPWHPSIVAIKENIEERCNASFNAVLLNLYRHGDDSMGWHSDDEPELGADPSIASISLGATRRFVMRQTADHQQKQEIALNSGSLLWMGRGVQSHWQHSLPKTKKVQSPRINLTFRKIYPS